jgi:hypothetical protein
MRESCKGWDEGKCERVRGWNEVRWFKDGEDGIEEDRGGWIKGYEEEDRIAGCGKMWERFRRDNKRFRG